MKEKSEMVGPNWMLRAVEPRNDSVGGARSNETIPFGWALRPRHCESSLERFSLAKWTNSRLAGDVYSKERYGRHDGGTTDLGLAQRGRRAVVAARRTPDSRIGPHRSRRLGRTTRWTRTRMDDHRWVLTGESTSPASLSRRERGKSERSLVSLASSRSLEAASRRARVRLRLRKERKGRRLRKGEEQPDVSGIRAEGRSSRMSRIRRRSDDRRSPLEERRVPRRARGREAESAETVTRHGVFLDSILPEGQPRLLADIFATNATE
ncbi:hypothetical protein KM043_007313 [Ampulex compressa]|nr:hypothetical protein KM043_007313 [Ampulex compressa]